MVTVSGEVGSLNRGINKTWSSHDVGRIKMTTEIIEKTRYCHGRIPMVRLLFTCDTSYNQRNLLMNA